MWKKSVPTIQEEVIKLHRGISQHNAEIVILEKRLLVLQGLCPHPGDKLILLTSMNEIMDVKACDDCGKILE